MFHGGGHAEDETSKQSRRKPNRPYKPVSTHMANEHSSDDESPSATNEPNASLWQRFCCYCFETDDASYLAFFRLMWGSIMFYEIYTMVVKDYTKMYYLYYQNPLEFNFKYPPFDGPELMDEELMKYFLWFMMFAALCVTIGFWFRLFAGFFFVGMAYLFLLESNNYLNHIYLTTMMCFLMIWLPCNCCFSVDALLYPSVRRDRIPKYDSSPSSIKLTITSDWFCSFYKR